jgi:hypothetical protein
MSVFSNGKTAYRVIGSEQTKIKIILMLTNPLLTNLLNLINLILFLSSNREYNLFLWSSYLMPEVQNCQVFSFESAYHKKGEIINLIFGDKLTMNGHLLTSILLNEK